MRIEKKTLKVSEEITNVSPDNTVAFELNPVAPTGSKIIIDECFGAAAYSKNSVVKLVWDYSGGGETILWSSKGDNELKSPIMLTDTNGVKKLAVVAENGESGPVVLYIEAKLRVVT